MYKLRVAFICTGLTRKVSGRFSGTPSGNNRIAVSSSGEVESTVDSIEQDSTQHTPRRTKTEQLRRERLTTQPIDSADYQESGNINAKSNHIGEDFIAALEKAAIVGSVRTKESELKPVEPGPPNHLAVIGWKERLKPDLNEYDEKAGGGTVWVAASDAKHHFDGVDFEPISGHQIQQRFSQDPVLMSSNVLVDGSKSIKGPLSREEFMRQLGALRSAGRPMAVTCCRDLARGEKLLGGDRHALCQKRRPLCSKAEGSAKEWLLDKNATYLAKLDPFRGVSYEVATRACQELNLIEGKFPKTDTDSSHKCWHICSLFEHNDCEFDFSESTQQCEFLDFTLHWVHDEGVKPSCGEGNVHNGYATKHWAVVGTSGLTTISDATALVDTATDSGGAQCVENGATEHGVSDSNGLKAATFETPDGRSFSKSIVVTCCKTLPPEEIGMGTELIVRRCLNATIEGGEHSCTDDDSQKDFNCIVGVSFVDAVSACSSAGYRLCTKAEIEADKTSQSGCNFDAAYSWAADCCGGTKAGCIESEAEELWGGIQESPGNSESKYHWAVNPSHNAFQVTNDETHLNSIQVDLMSAILAAYSRSQCLENSRRRFTAAPIFSKAIERHGVKLERNSSRKILSTGEKDMAFTCCREATDDDKSALSNSDGIPSEPTFLACRRMPLLKTCCNILTQNASGYTGAVHAGCAEDAQCNPIGLNFQQASNYCARFGWRLCFEAEMTHMTADVVQKGSAAVTLSCPHTSRLLHWVSDTCKEAVDVGNGEAARFERDAPLLYNLETRAIAYKGSAASDGNVTAALVGHSLNGLVELRNSSDEDAIDEITSDKTLIDAIATYVLAYFHSAPDACPPDRTNCNTGQESPCKHCFAHQTEEACKAAYFQSGCLWDPINEKCRVSKLRCAVGHRSGDRFTDDVLGYADG